MRVLFEAEPAVMAAGCEGCTLSDQKRTSARVLTRSANDWEPAQRIALGPAGTKRRINTPDT